MASILRAQWGGQIYDSQTAGVPVEIWTNSMYILSTATGPQPGEINSLATALSAWVQRPNSSISATVRLEYLKLNEIDPQTGKQITDPTNEVSFTGSQIRGGISGDNAPMITQAYRISLDNGTRNARARGGFFAPRPAITILYNGRWATDSRDNAGVSAQTFLNAVNQIGGFTVGVYSRLDQGIAPSTRLRVGNIPDNISLRKNALPEAYQELPLTP